MEKDYADYKNNAYNTELEIDVQMSRGHSKRAYLIAKRAIDIILSIVLAVLLSPVILTTWLLILIFDGYPAIFSQKRVGQNCRIFTCYKFRSMNKTAPSYVPKEDLEDAYYYITKFGSFIRKLSIDELPQLWNIFKGDMSFVGPRPMIESDAQIQNLRKRYGICELKPGLTGYAQIMGRDLVSCEEKIELEKYYLEKRSFGFDLLILLKTIPAALFSKGYKDGKKSDE